MQKSGSSKFVFLIFFPILLFLCQICFGQSAPADILYILDASGSMQSLLEGKERFGIAKEVMENAIQELPDETNCGLLVFGNNIKGRDCIRYPVPLGPDTKNDILIVLRSLIPGGLTPLAQSIDMAGNFLKNNRIKNASVVVITDGKEECGGDPFAAASALSQAGLNIELHIIGLAVDESTRKELKNIAELGAGFFYDAYNKKELKKALIQASLGAQYVEKQILRLVAEAGVLKTSQVLHTIEVGQVLKIKFKPIAAVGKAKKTVHLIVFEFGKLRLLLEDLDTNWALTTSRGDRFCELAWPKDLEIKRLDWNEIRIDKGKVTTVSINEKPIRGCQPDEVNFKFRVGVNGYEAEFTDLTTSLPLY